MQVQLSRFSYDEPVVFRLKAHGDPKSPWWTLRISAGDQCLNFDCFHASEGERAAALRGLRDAIDAALGDTAAQHQAVEASNAVA